MFGVAFAGFEPIVFRKPQPPPIDQAHLSARSLAGHPADDLWYFSSRILGLPHWLHATLARAPPMNYVFHDPEASSRKRYAFLLLSNILGMYSSSLKLATSHSPLKEAQIVFIHFDDLGSRNCLPSRQSQRKGTLFVGFGRSVLHTNPKTLPSFALLFKSGSLQSLIITLVSVVDLSFLGGILTFTPTVFIRQPLRVMDLLFRMRQDYGHWVTYAPAYILGAAFVDYYQSEEQAEAAYEA